MKNFLVSIICPYRNGRDYMAEMLRSIIHQKYYNWELLLINDNSSDKSNLIALDMAKSDRRIKCYDAPERGLMKAQGPWWPRNYGIQKSRGDLIAFIDVDDLWHSDKLEKQVELLKSEKIDMVVSSYARFNNKKRILDIRTPPAKITYQRLLKNNCIPMLTVVVKKSYLDATFQDCKHEDYLYWLTIFKNKTNINCLCCREILAYHRRHDKNISKNKFHMIFWSFTVYQRHGLNLFSSSVFLLMWILYQTKYIYERILHSSAQKLFIDEKTFKITHSKN